MADTITFMNDGRRLAEGARAAVSDPLEGAFTAPSKTSVISRDAPILVQRQSDSGTNLFDMQTVGEMSNGPAVPVIETSSEESVQHVQAEDVIGVQPTLRAASVVVRPTSAPAAPTAIRESVQTVMRSAPQSATAVSSVQVMKKKVRVRISNPAMGKMTVSVQSVAVSDSLVILAYPKDADSIIEPPEADAENPVIVEVGETAYKCMSGSWTAELEGLFLVVLVRLRD